MKVKNRYISFPFPSFILALLVFCLGLVPFVVSGAGANREDSLHKALVKATDDNQRVKLYLSLASLLKNRAADSSLLFLERAQKICWKTGSLENLGKIFKLKGEISNMKSNPGEAIRQFKIAEFLFRKIGNKRQQAQTLTWIGIVYNNNYTVGSSISESYRYYIKALGVARETNDTSTIVALYNNLGTQFSDARDYRAAIDYYKKAQVMYDRWNDSVNRAFVYLNLGSIYINSGNFDSSRSCFEIAIPIFRAKNNQTLLLASLAGFSFSLLKEQRYAEAMTYAEQALKYIMASGFQENSALSRVALSDIYSIMGLVNYETGSYGLAREYLLRGYHLLDSLEDYSRIRGIAEPLAMIYQKAGHADSALLIYQRILIKSDTFTNNQITSFSKLFTAQMEYEKEVREQQLQLQFRKTIQKRNLMIFIGSGILLISFVIILLLRLRLEQQKKKRVEVEKKQAVLEKQQAVLEKETVDLKLESQTREMTMNVMNLIRKNELMLDFSNRLVLIGQNTDDERTGSEIMQLITLMEQTTNNNVWEEFELRFRQVHNSYYERLLARFPDLSPGDLKLCALLKLNLSTKEICELSGQRPSTLDMARYRLRKKLGLTPQDNLVTFLSQV